MQLVAEVGGAHVLGEELGVMNLLLRSPIGTSFGRCLAISEIVKRGNAVGLGPNPNSARPDNVVVADLDVELAVEQHPDSLSHELDAQRMPLVLRYRGIDVLDRVSV